MQDTQVTIFSKNRALQLDALLQTLKKYAPNFIVDVIYTYDDETYRKGYEIIKLDYPNIRFHEESVFQNDVTNILDESNSEYFCFMCDDDLLFREISFPESLPSAVICLSLRLGKNTTYCFNMNRAQKYTGREEDGFLVWDWHDADWDFGYPSSVDGNIFRANDLKELLSDISYKSPIELEDSLTIKIRTCKMGIDKPKMMSQIESSLVGVPNNKVLFKYPFPHAGGSTLKLNEMYLAGKRINPFKMDYTNIKGAHQIIPFVF